MRFGEGSSTNWRRVALDLSNDGHSPRQVREAMERAGCLPSTARRAIIKMQERGLIKRVPRESVSCGFRNGTFPLQKNDPGFGGDNGWISDAAAACDKHLQDLKDAGHRPGAGELPFRRDLDKPTHYVRPSNLHSYLGSSAAMAAELA